MQERFADNFRGRSFVSTFGFTGLCLDYRLTLLLVSSTFGSRTLGVFPRPVAWQYGAGSRLVPYQATRLTEPCSIIYFGYLEANTPTLRMPGLKEFHDNATSFH